MTRQFGDFTAGELYCPKCRRAQPVREKLLLILPTGELHDYLCTGCGESLGKRTTSGSSARPSRTPPPAAPRSARPPRGLLS
jgi:hypothetical protein